MSRFVCYCSSKENEWPLYCSWCHAVRRPLKVSPYIIKVQVIFYFLWDHWAHPSYFENRIPLKQALGEHMQCCKPQCCIWRDSIKPSLRFSWFCVFFDCKGNTFLLLISYIIKTALSNTHAYKKQHDMRQSRVLAVRFVAMQIIYWAKSEVFRALISANTPFKYTSDCCRPDRK